MFLNTVLKDDNSIESWRMTLNWERGAEVEGVNWSAVLLWLGEIQV